MHLSKEVLHRMEQVDQKKSVTDSQTDVCEIDIDEKKYTVTIGYTDCAETLDDRMWQYIGKVAEIKY